MAGGDDVEVDLEAVTRNAERLHTEIVVAEARAIGAREILNEAKAGLALATSRLADVTERLSARLSER